MKMTVKMFTRTELLEYECELSSEHWKQNIKNAIDHFSIKEPNLEIFVSYLYNEKTGFTKCYFLQELKK